VHTVSSGQFCDASIQRHSTQCILPCLGGH
jgi:hypothetical protein